MYQYHFANLPAPNSVLAGKKIDKSSAQNLFKTELGLFFVKYGTSIAPKNTNSDWAKVYSGAGDGFSARASVFMSPAIFRQTWTGVYGVHGSK